jgi:hypothetical protein
MAVTLTLHEVRSFYLHFFGYPMPDDMPYAQAARAVIKEVGMDTVIKLQREEKIKSIEKGGD